MTKLHKYIDYGGVPPCWEGHLEFDAGSALIQRFTSINGSHCKSIVIFLGLLLSWWDFWYVKYIYLYCYLIIVKIWVDLYELSAHTQNQSVLLYNIVTPEHSSSHFYFKSFFFSSIYVKELKFFWFDFPVILTYDSVLSIYN